ncbi:MAG: ABC transporter substrate-binding protein [Pseudomonadota bacterium]
MTYKGNQGFKLNRRTLLAGAAAGSAALWVPGLAGKPAAAAPKAGGHFRIGVGGGATTDTLDPATYASEMLTLVAYCIGNHLTEITPSGDLVPELAESFEPSADAKTWRFNLRKGVTFHNGQPLTAQDVILSYQQHMGEDSKSAAKSSVGQIESFKADGDHTVVFTLAAGNADFPYLLSDYRLPILPAKDGKLEWQQGQGTGPYMLQNFNPGVAATFTKNPNYWKADAAYFDSVEIITILDPAARQNALVTGEVDAIDTVDPKTANRLGQVSGLRLLEVPSRLHHAWPMRIEAKPFDNVDFRLAIKWAIDREDLLRKILFGRGTVGNDQPLSAVYRYYADLPQRSRDIDKAKFHLKKSGLGENVAVDLSASDGAYSGAVDAAVLIKEQLAPAGINVNVVREPKDGYWSSVWRTKPWCAAYWYGRPTADWMFSTAYAAESPFNDTGWQNAPFNTLLVEARAELDHKKRAEMYGEMQSLVRDQAATAVTTFSNHVMAVSDKIKHPEQISGVYALDGGKAVERWWFA